MYRPYTNHYPEAAAIAAQVVGVTLLAAVIRREPAAYTRGHTAVLRGDRDHRALVPTLIPTVFSLPPTWQVFHILQASRAVRHRGHAAAPAIPRAQAAGGAWAVRTLAASLYIKGVRSRGSSFAYLFWYGLLIRSTP